MRFDSVAATRNGSMNITSFFEQEHVPFTVHRHGSTGSAQHMAHILHETGDRVAKTVLLKVDGEFVVAVLQATHNVDFPKLRAAVGARRVSLATEDELCERFPDCERGAVPPLGSKYGLRTLVDRPLACQSHLMFDGNTHEETIRMRYRDFSRLEQPEVAEFSSHV
jgi:Ala-tRNA(Pro) deacylase